MIIIQLAGGLGNQLQQYALYKKFESLGMEARLDTSWFMDRGVKESVKSGNGTRRELELAFFEDLKYQTCSEKEKIRLIGGKGIGGKLRRKLIPSSVHLFQESAMYHPEIFGFENMYLSGYFACEKYYRDILETIREEIRFPESPDSANKHMAEEMRACRSVSVHIRRGDYLKAENAAMFGNICTDAYYEAAIRKIRETEPEAHFYLFSDDVSYLKKNYKGGQYTVVDINHGRDSFYDMWLMSNCRHNICANSTFSFWGARLNRNKSKRMIRPAIHKNGQVFVKEEMEELWQGWSFINPEGREV